MTTCLSCQSLSTLLVLGRSCGNFPNNGIQEVGIASEFSPTKAVTIQSSAKQMPDKQYQIESPLHATQVLLRLLPYSSLDTEEMTDAVYTDQACHIYLRLECRSFTTISGVDSSVSSNPAHLQARLVWPSVHQLNKQPSSYATGCIYQSLL